MEAFNEIRELLRHRRVIARLHAISGRGIAAFGGPNPTAGSKEVAG